MRTPIVLSATWQQVVTGASALVIQTTSSGAEIYIGAAPAANENGFSLDTEVPYNIPNLAALGGEVWARGRGVIRSAADV